jgi:hypothetical protein
LGKFRAEGFGFFCTLAGDDLETLGFAGEDFELLFEVF